MTRRLQGLVPAVLAAALLAGCGAEDIDGAQDRIDRTQEQIDRAKDAAGDPAGAAREEADRALEDAISPSDQP